MPLQSIGPGGPMVSRIGLGCMGLTGTWNAAEYGPGNVKRAVRAFEAAFDAGITLYDHADIYGGTTCETAFKECLKAVPGSRERIYIATKCGIANGYNLSYDYIMKAMDESLGRLGVDYVDLYQMHRPDPLAHPKETARALHGLVKNGKVRQVGVSNYYPEQVRALVKYLEVPLAANQISVSLRRLDPIYEGPNGGNGDGTLDQCMALGMTPLAYSPLAWGSLTSPAEEAGNPILTALRGELATVAAKYGATQNQIALAWLLKHPSGIIPLVGSTNPDHIREAVGAASIDLARNDWYSLWVAARGNRLP